MYYILLEVFSESCLNWKSRKMLCITEHNISCINVWIFIVKNVWLQTMIKISYLPNITRNWVNFEWFIFHLKLYEVCKQTSQKCLNFLLNKVSWERGLSQPNNNHNPNSKTTITVVGLRLSNCWEYHHHPPPPPHKLKTTW